MPGSAQPSVKGRPRDPGRDDAILDAAAALLAEVGFERMSVDAVAARAGVSKPTIYRRWPEGKAQVAVEAVVRRRAARCVPDTGTLRGDLLALVRDAAQAFERNAHLAAGIACRLREDHAFHERFVRHVVSAERALWTAPVERAVARGELPAAPVSGLHADIAPSILHTRIVMTREPVDGRFAEELVDHVLLPILHHRPSTHP